MSLGQMRPVGRMNGLGRKDHSTGTPCSTMSLERTIGPPDLTTLCSGPWIVHRAQSAALGHPPACSLHSNQYPRMSPLLGRRLRGSINDAASPCHSTGTSRSTGPTCERIVTCPGSSHLSTSQPNPPLSGSWPIRKLDWYECPKCAAAPYATAKLTIAPSSRKTKTVSTRRFTTAS